MSGLPKTRPLARALVYSCVLLCGAVGLAAMSGAWAVWPGIRAYFERSSVIGFVVSMLLVFFAYVLPHLLEVTAEQRVLVIALLGLGAGWSLLHFWHPPPTLQGVKGRRTIR
jgi:hypothetical protein